MKLTLDQVRELPPTVDLMTAARVLGIGRTKAYELARAGEFPVHVVRIGNLYRVSTADLDSYVQRKCEIYGSLGPLLL